MFCTQSVCAAGCLKTFARFCIPSSTGSQCREASPSPFLSSGIWGKQHQTLPATKRSMKTEAPGGGGIFLLRSQSFSACSRTTVLWAPEGLEGYTAPPHPHTSKAGSLRRVFRHRGQQGLRRAEKKPVPPAFTGPCASPSRMPLLKNACDKTALCLQRRSRG